MHTKLGGEETVQVSSGCNREMALNQNSYVAPVEENFFEFEVNSASIKLSFPISPPPEHSLYKKSYKRNSVKDSQYKYQLPLSSGKPNNDLKYDDHFIEYEISSLIVLDDWLRESVSTNVKRPFSGHKLKNSTAYLKSLFRKKLKFSSKTTSTPSGHNKLMNVVRKAKELLNTSKQCNAVKSPFLLSKKESHNVSNRKLGKVKGSKEICVDSLSESWIRSLTDSINWLSKTKQSSVSPGYYCSSSDHTDEVNCQTSRAQFVQEPENSVFEAIRHCKLSQMLDPL